MMRRSLLVIAFGVFGVAPTVVGGAHAQGPAAGPVAALGGYRLLGNQTVLATNVNLIPADPTIQETVSGPTVLDVSIPADARRTSVVLLVNQSISWHEIVSTAPLTSSIGLRLFIASSALPAPGSFEALSPFALGELVALYEHRVFTMGAVWGINSFDQWGVELGKVLALDLARDLTGDAVTGEHDASTRALVDRYRRLRGR